MSKKLCSRFFNLRMILFLYDVDCVYRP